MNSETPLFPRAFAFSTEQTHRSRRAPAWLLAVIVCVLAIFFSERTAYSVDYRFEHLGTEDGLSNNTVTSIIQDRRGFLWFGTLDGLNRYDGYSFAIFRHDIQDSTSLGSSRILSLFEDRSGTIWAGTEDAGLDRYDPASGKFHHYANRPSDPRSLSNNQVESIYEDRSGTLWIGTREGLNRLNRATGKFTRYYHNPDDPSSLASSHIGFMFEDTGGTFWIGGGDCLHRFDATRGTFTRFRPRLPHSRGDAIIASIIEKPRGTLWLTTWGSGLWKFDTATGQFTVFRHDPRNSGSLVDDYTGHLGLDEYGNLWIGTRDGLDLLRKGSGEFIHFSHTANDQSSISANGIWPVFQDRSTVLWFGTYRGGLNKLAVSRTRFAHYTADPKDPRSLSDNSVYTLYEDREGGIWAGTAHGFNRFDPKTGQFTAYRRQPGGLNADIVHAIREDPDGVFWIGTDGGGLNRFDPKTGGFRSYRANPEDPQALNSDWVFQIIDDGEGGFLIGTQTGLNRFDPRTGKCIDLTDISQGASCTALYREKNGVLWYGTNAGLTRYEPSGKKMERFVSSPLDSTTLSNDFIQAIVEDLSGTIWIGTSGGLNRFDRATGRFIRYTDRHGLISDSITDITADRHGNLWVCTNSGISRLDPRTGGILNLGFQDGMPFRIFEESSILRMRDGGFLVGGQEGIFTFRPESFRKENQGPPVAITGFRIFNREVKLDRPVWEMNRITLTHRDTFFSFEFAALDYTAPHHNQYTYRMEGFDRDWIYSGARRYASYTNLHPGKYIFRVKAANGNGVWNERGAAIEVIILPPFWATWWFRALCFLLLSGGVFGFHELRMMVAERQKKQLIALVNDRTRELEEKSRYLEQSEQMYRSLVETSPDAILIAELNGEIRMANHQAEEMLKSGSVETLPGRNILDFPSPPDRERFRSLWSTIPKAGALKNISLYMDRTPESPVPVELNALIIADREKIRIMGVLRDITGRKRMEEERAERERMRGVLETAGGVCHELNQPLQIISGYAEMLEPTEGVVREYEDMDAIRNIRAEVQRMAEITRKLSNITTYRTKEYAGGTRIIDLARASGNQATPRSEDSGDHPESGEERS